MYHKSVECRQQENEMENINITGGYFFSRQKTGYEEFNFTNNPVEILQALEESRKHQKMIALFIPVNSDELFVTAVDEIIVDEKQTTIVVKQYDQTGFIIEKNRIRLADIAGVCLLNSAWQNPYMKIAIKNKVPWLKVDDGQ
jgi:hypothetical protein